VITLDKQLKRYFGGFWNGVKDGIQENTLATALRMTVEFGAYVDAMARIDHARLHHVYEWGMVGKESGRLFELKVIPKPSGGAIITYQFNESVVPNDNGVVFANKATVMESGESVTFETNKPVPIAEDTFRVGEFTFIPGGVDTNGAFLDTFVSYFSTRRMPIGRNIVINASGTTSGAGYRDARRMFET
jgi:hypothetical protein